MNKLNINIEKMDYTTEEELKTLRAQELFFDNPRVLLKSEK